MNCMGAAIDQVLPARSGYLFRWAAFTLRDPHAKVYLVAALMASIALEGGVLVVMFLFDALLTRSASYIDPQISGTLGVIVLVGVLFILLSKPVDDWALRFFKGRLGFIQKLLLILPRLRRPEVLGGILVGSAGAWWVQMIVLQWIATSVGHELSALQSMAVLVVINLAIIVPLTPGNLGTLQAAFIFILGKMGFAVEEALLCSILFQVIHSVPIFALALGSSLWSARTREDSMDQVWKRFKKARSEESPL